MRAQEMMRTMNKYEKALYTVKRSIGEHGWFGFTDIEPLQELVDIYPEYLELKAKATPMKPNNYRKYSSDSDAWGKCPNCNKEVCDYAGKYCPNCSQALDWSENDE